MKPLTITIDDETRKHLANLQRHALDLSGRAPSLSEIIRAAVAGWASETAARDWKAL
jgi:hypothetical protein